MEEVDSDSEEENDKAIDLTPGALSRTDDPVRLYLKEMGSVALLSREGEIEVREIVPVQETEEDFEEDQPPVERDYEELRIKTLESLNAVRKVSLALKALAEKGKHLGGDPVKQKKFRRQFDAIRQQVVNKIESVNLHG